MKRRLLLLALCLLVFKASAQEPPGVYQSTLPNGMALFVKVDRRAPTAVQMLWLRVGSVDEVDGTSGIAHAQEHMMFKGSAALAPGAFSRRIAELGGTDNAFTTRDHTGYHQQVPAERLEDAMRLQAENFANNRWDDAEFTREIEVVKEERRLRTDENPRATLFEQLAATAFVASPYHRPIVGWMNDLDHLRPDEVREFYRRWYVPGNAALVVAGDVDPQQVRAWAERYYGAQPARETPPRKPRVEPVQRGMRRIEVKAPADQAYVALAFKSPTLSAAAFGTGELQPDDRDALALTMLTAVLDGYSGARMTRALTQGEARVADSVDASCGLSGRGPQLCYLTGVPARGRTTEQLEAALRAEVARVAREGVSAAELARVQVQWRASEVYKLDSVFSQARAIGSNWVLGLPPDADTRLLRRLAAVTPQQVQDVAARYFGDDQLTVAVLRPQPRDPARTRPPAGAGAGAEPGPGPVETTQPR